MCYILTNAESLRVHRTLNMIHLSYKIAPKLTVNREEAMALE
jgi:hypothetical protein